MHSVCGCILFESFILIAWENILETVIKVFIYLLVISLASRFFPSESISFKLIYWCPFHHYSHADLSRSVVRVLHIAWLQLCEREIQIIILYTECREIERNKRKGTIIHSCNLYLNRKCAWIYDKHYTVWDHTSNSSMILWQCI